MPVEAIKEPATRAALDVNAKHDAIRAAWIDLLHRLAPVLTGQRVVRRVPADEFFVDSLRASLAPPFVATRDEISARKEQDQTFRDGLVRWMIDEQGWPHDPAKFEDEVAHVAQVATYVFATRLLFYGALRRARRELPALELPAGGDSQTGRDMIENLFRQARDLTGDYATVFVFDDVTRWALISDDSCLRWRLVIEFLDHFELDTIGFDVLGRLFERLIDPHERYAWGQHYTAPDVVDLMLAAALPDGRGSVADFASGGGTFLVRAYTRKRAYEPKQSHEQRLSEIAGGDISAFAASLSTIGLASQHLDVGSNYPQVRSGSFFSAAPDKTFMTLPGAGGLPEDRIVSDLDAVVCNPPYIAYSAMGATRKAEAEAAYSRDWPTRRKLAEKWNYHLPFWFHGAKFLKPGGRLAFITSGEWLDSDYGAQLQDWLLSGFHIELVIESMAEQWFGEARVGTVVVVARKYFDGEQVANCLTRFVTLRKPLRDLYAADVRDDTVRLLAVDAFRDRLLSLTGEGEGDDFDHRVVAQQELRELGTIDDRYVGAPWRSMYLRSPHLAHTYAARHDFTPVGDIAELSLGGKTGADGFFFLRRLGSAGPGRVRVRGVRGWVGELRSKLLRPALRRPGDLDLPSGGRRFKVPRLPESLYFAPPAGSRGSDLQEYVTEGEAARVHEGDLVQTNGHPHAWYRQVRSIDASPWVLPYNSAYDYFAADNAVEAVLNGRLVGAKPKAGVDSDLLGAVLNSTFMLLARLLVGVQTGNEGAYDVGPPALRTARVPDPRKFSPEGVVLVKGALSAIRDADRIPPAPEPSGAVTALRRQLDSAILQALGVTPGEAAVELDRIYAAYARWRGAVRVVELQVQDNRRRLAARGGHRSEDPNDRAAKTVLDEIRSDHRVDLAPVAASGLVVEWVDAIAPEADRQDALLEQTIVVLRGGGVLDLGSGARVDYLRAVRSIGLEGPIGIPHSAAVCSLVAGDVLERGSALVAAAATHAQRHVGQEQVGVVTELVSRLWKTELARELTAVIPRPVEVLVEAPVSVQPSIFDPVGLVPPAP